MAQGISLFSTQAPSPVEGTRTALPPHHLFHCLDQHEEGDDGEDDVAKQFR